nr:hypothetical protein [Gordonia sp. NB41Y]
MTDVVDVVGWALRGSTAGVGIADQAAELFEKARKGLPAALSRSQQLLGGIVVDRRPEVDADGGPRWSGLIETARWDDGAERLIIVDQLSSREIDIREVGEVSVAASLAGPDLVEVSTRSPLLEAAAGPRAALELLVHDASIALGLVDGFIKRITELRRDRYVQGGGTPNWRADITEFLGRYTGVFQTLDGLIFRAAEIIDAGEAAGWRPVISRVLLARFSTRSWRRPSRQGSPLWGPGMQLAV